MILGRVLKNKIQKHLIKKPGIIGETFILQEISFPTYRVMSEVSTHLSFIKETSVRSYSTSKSSTAFISNDHEYTMTFEDEKIFGQVENANTLSTYSPRIDTVHTRITV